MTVQEVLFNAQGNARIAIGADVGSAYLLGAVSSFVFGYPITAAPFDLLILGTFVAAFIAIADPVNRIVAKRLRAHLIDSGHQTWVNAMLERLAPQTHEWEAFLKKSENRSSFLVYRARRAFWQLYLSKERARFTSGTLLAITLGMFTLGLVVQGLTPARLLLAFIAILSVAVVAWTLWRRTGTRVPGFCWTVCAYGMVQEYYQKDNRSMQLLDRIRNLLIGEEWEEARQLLTFFSDLSQTNRTNGPMAAYAP